MSLSRVFVSLFCSVVCAVDVSLAAEFQPNPNAGAGNVIVRGQFNGEIFGFDIDPNGREGLLSEAVVMSNGTIHAAVETFDQTSGAILAIVSETFMQSDYVTLGVVGNSIGLIESEDPVSLFHVKRRFRLLDPLGGHMFTSRWTPPLDRSHIVNQVKASQAAGTSDAAVYAIDVSTSATPIVFSANVAANTFGPIIPITDPIFTSEAPPIMVYDNERNQAILGHNFPSGFILPPRLGFANLTTGEFTMIKGQGLGVINGMAIDSPNNILCTTTSFNAGVQFYDFKNHIFLSKRMPGGGGQSSLAFGLEVVFDPINRFFLVAQPFSGTATSGSSIQVFDTAGNLVESIDGFNFQGGFNVLPIHIGLNPARRTGYVNGPDLTKALQSFTY